MTAQHYNSDPELPKKRSMMHAWVAWLEQQEAAAVAADPTPIDREAVAEQVYRIRYGDEAWRAALGRKRRRGCSSRRSSATKTPRCEY